jgi:hypothetical protein
VLSDNGKQFTGRHMRPQPVEVLFERVCRENGITQRLTNSLSGNLRRRAAGLAVSGERGVCSW